MKKKKIGILGGMGPLATVELFKQIVENTDSYEDKGHIRIFIDNNPQIPDRTEAILSNGVSPVPELVSSAQKLKQMGADFLIIPCNTSHYFINQVQEKANIEIVNMIEETARYLSKKSYKKVGILATSGTIESGIYSKYLKQYGIEGLVPEKKEQDVIMQFIYDCIKAGNREFDLIKLQDVISNLFERGAETLILGCTELSVGFPIFGLNNNCIDALSVLAKKTIKKAGYTVKE